MSITATIHRIEQALTREHAESPEDKIADALIAFKALTDQERQTFLAFIASGRAA